MICLQDDIGNFINELLRAHSIHCYAPIQFSKAGNGFLANLELKDKISLHRSAQQDPVHCEQIVNNLFTERMYSTPLEYYCLPTLFCFALSFTTLVRANALHSSSSATDGYNKKCMLIINFN